MSASTRSTRPGPALPVIGRAQVAAVVAGVVVGLLVAVVGLPHATVWDTDLADATVPVALAAGLGVSVVALAALARPGWRVVDITVAAVVAVVGGLFLFGVNAAWTPVSEPLGRAYPPLAAVLNGLWLVPGVLGALIVRKPGAALFTETLAAVLEALTGPNWGFASVYYGVVEGLGAEIVFAVLLYRRFGLGAALAAGAGSGVALSVLDLTLYYPTYPAGQKAAYAVLSILSGALIAGAGSWALTRALARTGALASLASGRTAERV